MSDCVCKHVSADHTMQGCEVHVGTDADHKAVFCDCKGYKKVSTINAAMTAEGVKEVPPTKGEPSGAHENGPDKGDNK